MQLPLSGSAWVSALAGVLVIGGALFLATNARRTGSVIDNYYANLKQKKRGWGVLAGQFVPNDGVSLALAWLLIAMMLVLGGYFVSLALRGG